MRSDVARPSKRRAGRSVFALLAFILVVGACGDDDDSGAATTAAGETATTQDTREVTLTFLNWYWGPGDEDEYTAQIDAYKAADPRLKDVVIEVQPFDRFHDVLNVKLASGNPADIAWINSSFARKYVESGALYDLRPTLEAIPGWDLDDFPEASLSAWSHEGGIFALPFTNATNAVWYKVEAFTEAGLPTPDDMVANGTWTWENVQTVAKQLVDSGAVRFGFSLQNDIFINGWDQLIPIWAPYGGGPWSEDGKACTFNSAGTVEATQIIHDMIFTDESHPGPGVDVLFATGDIGMALARPDIDQSELLFDWGVVSQPDGPLGYYPSVAQNGLAVFDSPNADIAAGLVAEMLSPKQMLETPVFPPGNRVSLQTPELLVQSIPGMTLEQVTGTVIKAFNAPNALVEYTHPNFAPIWSTAQRIFDGEMWQDGADVAAVLDTVCENVKDLLG